MKKYKIPLPYRIRNTLSPRPRTILWTLWRSGTHWVADMLSEMMRVQSFYARIHEDPRAETIEQIRAYRPNTLLVRHITHGPEDIMPLVESGGFKLILVIRDPRDVIASTIHMMKYVEGYREGLPPFPDMPLEEIFNWELDNLREAYTQRLPAWGELEHPAVLRVRYEDMHADALRELKRMRDFLGLRESDARLQGIVAKNTFEARAKRKPGQEDKSAHNRKGVIGDFRSQFTPEQQARLNALLGDTLTRLGYPL